MRDTVATVDNNENVYSDKIYKLNIEQLDISEYDYLRISDEIKSLYKNKLYATSIVWYSEAYLRIYNYISYLNSEFLSKEDVLNTLNKIKVEIQYINNKEYAEFKKSFLSCVDEKSNLHKIHKLEECIDDLYVLVNNQKVDN